jgi:hypothetical protein
MWTRWIEYVAKEETVSDFLAVHSDCVERAEHIHGRRQLIEVGVVQEQPF